MKVVKEKMTIEEERKLLKRYPVWVRGILATHSEVKKTYRSRQGLYVDGWKRDIIAEIAMQDLFKGTGYRKKYPGENCDTPGIRTRTNGKCGWKKVVWHYADYTAIADRSGHKIAYRTNPTDQFEIFYSIGSLLMARGKIYRKPVVIDPQAVVWKPRHLRRFYSLSIPAGSGITWEWNREEGMGYYRHGGEKYHTPAIPDTNRNSRSYLREAVQAFRKRKHERIEKEKEAKIFSQLDRIFVQFEDSIKAGNCYALSEVWANKMKSLVGAEGDCAIRADVIWGQRSDAYARRAILQAAKHSHLLQ